MASDTAFLEGYGGIEIELPNGKMLRRPAPTLAEGVFLLKALMMAEAGDPLATITVLEKFPDAIGVTDEFDGLTPAEVFEVARRFLAHRRTRLADPATETTTERSSTRASTT